MAIHAPLFGDLVRDDAALQAELAKVAVAADLAALAAQKGVSRTELAQRLGWSKARVSQVLGGKGNLTVETIHAVAHALGSRADMVFRQPDEARLAQPWERRRLQLEPGANVVVLSSTTTSRVSTMSRRSAAPHFTFTQVLQGEDGSTEQVSAA